MSSGAQPAPPGSPERILTADFALACGSSFAAFASFYLLLATLPAYVVRIGGSESEVGAVIGSFSATALALRLRVGRAADVHGRKPFVLVGAALMVAGALLYHLAHRPLVLFGMRVVHGAGWALLGSGLNALVADLLPRARRGEGVGWYGMSGNLAMAVGPAAGVYLMHQWGFGTLFDAAAAVALLGLLLSLPLREPARAAAARRGPPAPLVEPSALFPSAVTCLFSTVYGAIVTFLAVYADRRGLGNPGLFFTVFAVTLVLSRSAAGAISDRQGRGAVIVPGLVIPCASMALLSVAADRASFLASAALFGLGFATAQPALMALVVDRSPPSRRGAAMGMFSTAMDLGIALGSFVWGAFAEHWGFSAMYRAAGALSLVAAAVFAVGSRLGRRTV